MLVFFIRTFSKLLTTQLHRVPNKGISLKIQGFPIFSWGKSHRQDTSFGVKIKTTSKLKKPQK